MRLLINGTGLVLFVAFAVGVGTGIAWLMLAALVLTVLWTSFARTAGRTPRGWDRV